MTKVLFFDSNHDDIRMLKSSLEPLEGVEVEVVAAEDRQQFYEQLTSEHPDLIVMDLQMPGLDGLEVIRRLKSDRKTRDIPVIVMSAYRQRDVEADFVAKPVTMDRLSAAVRAALRRDRATPPPADTPPPPPHKRESAAIPRAGGIDWQVPARASEMQNLDAAQSSDEQLRSKRLATTSQEVPTRAFQMQNLATSDGTEMPAAQEEGFDSALVAALTTGALNRFRDKKRAYTRISDGQIRATGTEAAFRRDRYSTIQMTSTFSVAEDELPPSPQIRQPRRTATFSPVQEWEGDVVTVTPTHIIANLIDLTAGSMGADEEAEIPIQELNETDAVNLRPGQVFRWAIGYQTSPVGVRMRVSQIVFRQLPQWSERDIEEAKGQAREMATFLRGEEH